MRHSASSENDHKRIFLTHYQRWARMFKGKDGDINDERWLIAEYYDSLRHLSPEGFDLLTKRLKETCTFFPTIRECLDLITPKGQYDWGHPFLSAPQLFRATNRPVQQISAQPETKLLEG